MENIRRPVISLKTVKNYYKSTGPFHRMFLPSKTRSADNAMNHAILKTICECTNGELKREDKKEVFLSTKKEMDTRILFARFARFMRRCIQEKYMDGEFFVDLTRYVEITIQEHIWKTGNGENKKKSAEKLFPIW